MWASVVLVLLLGVGVSWWIRHPLSASFSLGSSSTCLEAPCTHVHYRVTNHSFTHLFMRCKVRLIGADGRILRKSELRTVTVPIGPEIGPWSTIEGTGWIDGTAPDATSHADGSCSPLYGHGPPPA